MRCLTLLLTVASFVPLAAEGPKITVVRRIDTTEEELRQQLLDVKEVGYTQQSAAALYEKMPSGRGRPGTVTATPPVNLGVTHFANQNQNAAASLPWKKGADTTRGKDHAQTLNDLSTTMRANLRNAAAGAGNTPEPAAMRRLVMSEKQRGIHRGEWQKVEAIPTLMQMLQVEGPALREMLVDILAGIEGPEATKALTQRALFELTPAIRQQAVQVLADRPEAEYRQALLDGLRYPWPPVNDHAAEAIIALQRTEYTGRLVNMLKEPDPRRPGPDAKGNLVQELVRINHMSNCLLCHAVSTSKDDLVRGLIPEPYKPAPPAYYTAPSGSFARADITYLRQDFSLFQPVLHAGQWPGQQRYDYLVRTRSATDTELLKGFAPRTDLEVRNPVKEHTTGLFSAKYPERGAILFALRTLTKKNLGATFTEWAAFADKDTTATAVVDTQAEGHALSVQYRAAKASERPALLLKYQNEKGSEYTLALAALLKDSPPTEEAELQTVLVTRFARMNATTLTGYMRDRDPLLRKAATQAAALKDKAHMASYVPTLLLLLADDSRAVVQAARQTLTTFAGVDHGPEPDAKGIARVQAVTQWQRWWAEQQRAAKGP